MSARLQTAFMRFLSVETREQVKSLVTVGRDDYASNVENRLRNLGEHELANQMLEEIEDSLSERRQSSNRMSRSEY